MTRRRPAPGGVPGNGGETCRLDLVGRMEERGEISPDVANVARRWQDACECASTIGMRSSRLDGIGGGPKIVEPPVDRITAARQQIDGVVRCCGGPDTLVAAALLAIVGSGEPVSVFVQRQRAKGLQLNAHSAKGVVIAGLDVLAGYYRRGQRW